MRITKIIRLSAKVILMNKERARNRAFVLLVSAPRISFRVQSGGHRCGGGWTHGNHRCTRNCGSSRSGVSGSSSVCVCVCVCVGRNARVRIRIAPRVRSRVRSEIKVSVR